MRKERHLGNQGVWLALWIVLTHGDEVDRATGDQLGKAAEVLGEAVVCGEGDEQGSIGAQMCFCRHCDGRVGDASGDLCQGVARAGRNYEGVEGRFRAERLCRLHGVNSSSATEGFDPRDKVGGQPKSGVGGIGALADDRLDLKTPGKEDFQLADRGRQGTK